MEESIWGLADFLCGNDGTPARGTHYRDNRSALINARRSDDVAAIPRKTRHVALKFCKALTAAQRLWHMRTDLMKADGLTKSNNPTALRHIFVSNPRPVVVPDDEDNSENDLVSCFAEQFGGEAHHSFFMECKQPAFFSIIK